MSTHFHSFSVVLVLTLLNGLKPVSAQNLPAQTERLSSGLVSKNENQAAPVTQYSTKQWEERLFEMAVQHVPPPDKLAKEFGANWIQRVVPERHAHQLPSRTFHADSFTWTFEARKSDYVFHREIYLNYRESNSEKYSLALGLPVSSEWCIKANQLRNRLKGDGWRFVVIPSRFTRNHPDNAFYEKTVNHEITRVWMQQTSDCLFFISIVRYHPFSGESALDFFNAKIFEPN